MKFLIRIFFLLIISVLFFNNIEKEFVCPVECENDKHEVIFDKQLSDYENCVLNSVFEKPSFIQTVNLTAPLPSVRTINVIKKVSSCQNILFLIKHFCVRSHVRACDVLSECHPLSDIDIYYLFLRHIII